jgi:hypothetical protein
VISAKTTKRFESRLDKHWEAQELLYNYEADLTTSSELNSLEDEDLELRIVVGGQRSEANL